MEEQLWILNTKIEAFQVFMLLIFNSLAIIGIHNIFAGEGMIFKPITERFEKLIGDEWFWITKPLYNCPPCMILLYGFPLAYFVYDGQPYGYFWMFAYCIALSGLNKILTSIIYRD